MVKKVSESQKKEITKEFLNGVEISKLSQIFGFTVNTITRQLQNILGREKFLEIKNNKIKASEKEKENNLTKVNSIDLEVNKEKDVTLLIETSLSNNIKEEQSFFEIPPLEKDIEFDIQKDISSIPLSDVVLPKMVYMIVDKNTELKLMLLKEFPEWSFLPQEDLNRKIIKIYLELRNAKRERRGDQKVIKVPNSNVFKVAAPILLSKGITRIISETHLISL